MAAWDAIAIGSGLGGLAAAARLARAGRRVLVLERLANFGGAATIYRHDGRTIEASLHEIDGLELSSERGVMRELGVADKLQPIPVDAFYEARSPLFPHPVRVEQGIAGLEATLSRAFPQAAHAAQRYAGLLARLHDALSRLEDIGARGLAGLLGLLASGGLVDLALESGRTLGQELDRIFQDCEPAKLAAAGTLHFLDDDPHKTSLLFFAMVQTHYLEGGAYYLRGGSLSLTSALLEAIRDAGGEARRRCAVEEILLDSAGVAAGVRYRDAGGLLHEETAPILLGNAAPQTLTAMLPRQARDDFSARFADQESSVSLFTVQIGLSRPAAELGVGAYLTVLYPDWLTRLDQMAVSADVFGGEPGAAMPIYSLADYGRIESGLRAPGEPYGVSLVGVDRLWAWDHLDADQEAVRRRQWIDAFLADLERRFPGFIAATVSAEMATARTLKTRMGAPNGEAYGFRPTPRRFFARPPTPRTAVPGLWIASAFTVSGGYAGAMHGGLMAADAALRAQRRRRV